MEPVLFSQKIHVRNITEEKTHFELKGKADDLKLIAERLGLEGMSRFDLHADVYMHSDFPIIVVEGTMDAHYTQTCSVTLVPFEHTAPTPFLMYFTKDRKFFERTLHETIPLEDEGMELLEITTLDIVECAVQALSLSIDPYPRVPENT